jgi:hypothetical protein
LLPTTHISAFAAAATRNFLRLSISLFQETEGIRGCHLASCRHATHALSYWNHDLYFPSFSFQAPARVSLTVTTLLAMSTTTSSINNSLPPVAYTKAIDVWSNLCVTFVFLALLEYALVNYASRYKQKMIRK